MVEKRTHECLGGFISSDGTGGCMNEADMDHKFCKECEEVHGK